MEIQVAGKTVRCPDWLPKVGWSFDGKGYVVYSSRRKQDAIKRGERMHRIIARVLGAHLETSIHVAHQDHHKRNNQPSNLIVCPEAFNPSVQLRCPWTGRFMTREEYTRRLAA